MTINWDIRRKGRAWTREREVWERYQHTLEKMEIIDGRLVWSREEQLTMLGMLLESLGVDAAIRLGDPQVWQEAIAEL